MALRKLLVLDDYEGELQKAPAMKSLRELTDVTVLNRPLQSEDAGLLGNADILLALRERTKLNSEFFARCSKLKLVLQTGGHAYHIDLKAAEEAGVTIALGRRHTTKPTTVVPELVFGLLLGLVRRIYPLHSEMVKGAWPSAIGGSLHGRTLGILGYGRHGKPIARLAEAFGMKVIAWERDPKERGEPDCIDSHGVKRVAMNELLQTADVVSVHLKLSEESRGLIGRNEFKEMKKTALFINTSRGAIVDEEALVSALQSGEIAGAGLDVFAAEPLPKESPLRDLQNVLLTPHVGWQVQDVLHEFVAIACSQLSAWLVDQVNGIDAADILRC